MREPLRVGDVLRELLAGWGVADLDTWETLDTGWKELAGSPWDRLAKPVSLQKKVLVVEAVSPAAVSVLRYGVASLEQRLTARLGAGIVDEVRVRAPSRRPGR